MTFYFPAIIKKTAAGYHVRYVDLQDCFGEGATLDEALDEAREAGVNYILTELEGRVFRGDGQRREDQRRGGAAAALPRDEEVAGGTDGGEPLGRGASLRGRAV